MNLNINIKNIYHFLIVFSFIVPIQITLISFGSKPVDLVYSDLTLLIVIILIFIKKIKYTKTIKFFLFLMILNLIYGFTIAATQLILSGGELISLLSFMKLYKSFLFFLVGVYIAQDIVFIKNFEKNLIKSIIVVILIVFIGTILDYRFPVMRWGEYFFDIRNYGFPNAFMSFLSFLSIFILIHFFQKKNIFLLILYFIIGMLIIFSLSRSSSIIYILGFFLIFIFTINIKNKLVILGTTIFIFIFSTSLYNNNYSELSKLVEKRIDKSASGKDPSSGRFEIWNETITLISKKPVFGYLFQPYSEHHSKHDTPHEQYLEIIYKTGLIGFILYMSFALSLFRYLYIYKPKEHKDIINSVLIGFIIISIGNLTQPNYSYSLIGNLLFFIFGLYSNHISRNKLKLRYQLNKENK